MSLILNADDYGKNESVNRAIRECFKAGSIDRTTLMVNMPCAGDAARAAKEEGFADRVGLHLNLTEGMPLTEPIKSNPLFCDEQGRFHAQFRQKTVNRLYMDRLSLDQIYTELSAQLNRYAELGLSLFHIDSHHHIHTDYPIYRVVRKLAGSYCFSSIRLSRNLYHGGNRLNRIYKSMYNRSLKGLCSFTTDLFGSYLDLYHYGTVEENRVLLRENRIEIMLHPMYDAEGTLMDTDTPMSEVTAYLQKIGNTLSPEQ
ncbi:MAG: ChbG/HpnK family deacetylase [Lachnospiraceae bacterium]|nr:ChbG/HpnK family deacetylase [Lachnospiraceae bacterium]